MEASMRSLYEKFVKSATTDNMRDATDLNSEHQVNSFFMVQMCRKWISWCFIIFTDLRGSGDVKMAQK
jgi:hypothetical protein